MAEIDEVSQRIGARLAEIRREAGRRQEDVAAEARSLGLSWTQATIAALETGRRELGLNEFFLLPLVLQASCDVRLQLADLLSGERELMPCQAHLTQWDTRLSPRVGVSHHLLKLWLTGEPVTTGTEYLMTTEESARIATMRPGFDSIMQALPEQVRDEAWMSSQGEAERNAARSLGILSGAIGPASYLCWRRSLSAERDARARAHATPGESPRTTAARRGHITRQLLAELQSVLEDHGIKPNQEQRRS